MKMTQLLKTPSLCLGVFCILQLASAKLDPHIYCGACLAMIEDMKMMIGQVDKSKKLETGSYRLMPDGTQRRKEVSYATSELHLMELFEKICNNMSNYAETTDEKTGRKSIIRTSSYDGSPISLKNVKISGAITSSLKFACDTIIEEHEEEMIKVLQTDDTDPEKAICTKIAGVCTEEDVQARMWSMASAIMAGMKESEQSKNQLDDGVRETDSQEDSHTDEDSTGEDFTTKDSMAEDTPADVTVDDTMEDAKKEDITMETKKEDVTVETKKKDVTMETKKERRRRPVREKPDESDYGEDITARLLKEGSMTFDREEL